MLIRPYLSAVFLLLIAGTLKADLSLQRATITVSDLDESIAFYTEVVGFTLNNRSHYDTESLRTLFHLDEGANPELALLDASPDQPRALALVSADGVKVDADANRKYAPAILVNSTAMDELHTRALEHGVEVLLPPTALNDFSGKPFGREAAYYDPDGVRVVVFEYD